MILPRHEVERFYTIWFPLLYYVNQRRQLLPDFPATYGPNSVSPNDAAKLRDVLWAEDSLRDAFIAENPAGFAAADLAVASWKTRVSGDFYVFRQLKKYAVLIPQGGPPRAYGVLGLASPIEDIIPLAEDLVVYLTTIGEGANWTSFKHFVRFLRDTGRVEWQEAEAMLDELR